MIGLILESYRPTTLRGLAMGSMPLASMDEHHRRQRRYTPPEVVETIALGRLLADCHRAGLQPKQLSLLSAERQPADVTLYYSGDLKLLDRPAVAIVGAREVSEQGAARARRLARELSAEGVTIVSGLARGVDTNAHQACISAGGSTVAVIGTPLDQAYPAENRTLQEEIAARHLLISPFEKGTRVFPSSFPKRNRVMAAVSDATVIVEASDSSGSLHQAAECQRLGRWLFILKSVYDNPDLKWPRTFAGYQKARVVSSAEDILGVFR